MMFVRRDGLGRPHHHLAALALGAALLLGCSDDGKGSFTIGDDLSITVAPNPVTFGTVNVGAYAERVVTIRHAGNDGTLRLRSVTLVTASTELSISQPATYELAPGESTNLTVSYSPVDGLQDRGTLVIETNIATGGGTLTVNVPIETLTQVATLMAIPDPVDFGEVESHDVATMFVSFVNVGADTVHVTNTHISPGADGDFSLVAAAAPDSYAPGDNFTVEVAYAPTHGGADTGTLRVEFTVDGVDRSVETLLKGREVGPKLVAFPNPIDFGWRPIDVANEQPLNLSNQGTRPLRVSALRLADWSSATVELLNVPAGEPVVAPGSGNVLPLAVRFTPRSDMVQTTGPIAAVIVESNDSQDGGVFQINVFGRAEAPVLQVNPPDSVDFGFVAQNLSMQRTLTLYNAGSAPLQVSDIAVIDNPTGEFELVAGAWTSGSLPPGEYQEVRVTFTNRGAATGTQWAKLQVSSNDGQRPVWPVDLRAQRTDSPKCEVTLVPSQLDFGTVGRGFKKTMTANLVNVGSGDCSFHSALANDCASFFGFFGGVCDDPNVTPQLSGNSNYYKVTLTPPAIQNGLKPGQSYPIEVTFTPPETAPIFGDELVDYGGLLGVRIIDPYSGTTVPVLYPPPQSGGLSPYTPNLHAKSGIANLAVLPSEVDFGLVTIGCHSQTFTVTAYNVGSAPLDLTDITFQGCNPEFKLKSVPGLPVTLSPNASAQVEVVYVPQNLGADSCGLAFYANAEATPAIVVPLRGAGTFESSHTDEFIQTAGTEVDILFVVDNSGSMSDTQTNLSNNFQAFIQAATSWNSDFQIGVTSTDMDADAGRLMGTPRYVTPANWQSFITNVKLGTNGSAHEQGLAAAQAALSLPLTGDTSVACANDAACAAPERCYGGFCGGRNRGFIRPNAALEVVFVSDEEDQSPSNVNFYVNFFKSIKGFYNDNLFHAHAIVGPAGGCQSSAGSASAGLRYIHVAQATGGSVGSICDPSFAASLSGIGDIAFGLRTQFFLSRLADPSTIVVTVAGAGCTSQGGQNWVYDPPSNSVLFNEAGGCFPQVDQLIQVYYETLCLLQ